MANQPFNLLKKKPKKKAPEKETPFGTKEPDGEISSKAEDKKEKK